MGKKGSSRRRRTPRRLNLPVPARPLRRSHKRLADVINKTGRFLTRSSPSWHQRKVLDSKWPASAGGHGPAGSQVDCRTGRC